MSVSLQKGQKVELTKGNPSLNKIMIGLGWDVNTLGGDFDLDASAFMLDSTGKCKNEKDFIYFGNLQASNGSIIHTGDNLTGEGDGDDEVIKIDISKIDTSIEKVVFTITIYDAKTRNQNFGQVTNAFIRVVDESSNTEVIRYDLSEDFSIETSVIVGEMYRHNGEWKFNAMGNGVKGEISELCRQYGINV